ncbi:MAG: hypothetical protein JNK02_00385 [Planctomycetes bacterium]|nr:hypothetical protein [Planctomycetota bacterium]
MRTANPTAVLSGLLLACAAACAAPPHSPGTAPEAPKKVSPRRPLDKERAFESLIALQHPQPTEGGMIERVERDKAGRARWIEELHKAAEGVDWREIEAANARSEERRRARMASQQQLTAGSWTEVGSRNQCGRIHTVARVEGGDASSPLWIGADLGGAWRGNPDGTGWQPKSDDVWGGAHHLVVVPSDVPGAPDVVLQATDGGRVRITRDDGATWQQPAGLPALSSCRGVGVLADAARTILIFGQYTPSGTRPGVFASTDNGRTFTNRWTGSQNHPGWMWVPRKAPFQAAHCYVLHRGVLYASTNGAQTFQQRGTVNANATRGILAGSEAGAPTLYAAVEVSGSWRLHRSDDAGSTWAQVSTLSDLWDGTLCASTIDPLRVMHGGVEAWRSSNGGVTFTKINGWGEYYGNPASKLHADLPGIACWPDPAGGERWFFGTDGGLYQSLDGGLTVQNLTLTGIGTSQYYSTHTSRANPDRIQAGSQDQGYQRGIYQTPTGNGPSTDFAQLISGDYGHLTSSDGTHGLVYSTYPGFVLIAEGETNPALRQANFPSGSTSGWLPMVTADPLDPNRFFFCGDKLYRYTRIGNNWSSAAHTTFNFLTGGATYITAVAFAPSDPQRMYAANNAGRLFTSANHGVGWVESANTGPSPHYFYGNSIAVHPTNPLEAVVGGSGYSTAGVRRTLDGGATWSALTNGLPATLVYDLAYAEDGTGDVYAAAESGAWRFVRATGAWVNILEVGTPITLYWSVEAVPERHLMRFGTYARGIWDYRLPTAPPIARWVRYGENLGGANVLDLDSPTPPTIGTTATLYVSAPDLGERTGWLLHSDFGGSAPFGGGTLLADPITRLQRLRVAVDGTGAVRFPIPADPYLVGTTRYFQAILSDSNQPGGWSLSNGLEAQFAP